MSSPKVKQAWMLWVRPVGRPGWGQGFEGTKQEADAEAKKLAGVGGAWSVKGRTPFKGPVRRSSHGRRS